MAAESRAGLETADPRVGQTFQLDGHEWEVTDHSSYWNDEGYRVTEWCCETDDTEAYLLKEVKEGEPIRWFFTRKITAEAVSVPTGGTLATVLDKASTAGPPATLTYEGRSYGHRDTDEGTYEDEPGQRVRKTTWEYWDAGDAHNLAVERWQDGHTDCYHGAYIRPGDVRLGDAPSSEDSGEAPTAADGVAGFAASLASGVAAARAAASRAGATSTTTATATTAKRGGGANPFLLATVAVPLAYLLPFFLGRPLDQGLAVALPLAGLVGWLVCLFRTPGPAGLALLGLPALGAGFWFYPPLTTTGALMLVAGPVVVAWAGRGVGEGRRLPVLYAAAAVAAGPALALGFYHYFRFAPEPHTMGQLGLALGPAVVAAVVACFIGGLIVRTGD
jgi:hypothetical protein